MTKAEEVKQRLIYYNEWRRGGEGEQPNPTQLGHDLDYAVRVISSVEDVYKAMTQAVDIDKLLEEITNE